MQDTRILAARMTEETIATPSSDDPQQEVRLRRQYALSGLLATGAFFVEQLATHATALRGEQAWHRVGGAIERTDLLVFFELIFLLAPIAYHLVVGAKLAVPRAERISGALLAAFFLVHFWEFAVQRAFLGLTADGTYTRMIEDYSRTWGGIPLLALLAITGTGLASFVLARSLLALGRPRGLAVAIGAVLFVVGSVSIGGIATGSALLPAPSLNDAACGAAVEMPAR